MNKRLVILAVFLVLLLSFVPLLSRIVLDYKVISGLAFRMPQEGVLWYRPPNIAGNCPCPGDIWPGHCSDTKPYYCDSYFVDGGFDGGYDVCTLSAECDICGCSNGFVCDPQGSGYCINSTYIHDDDEDGHVSCGDGTTSGFCSLTKPLYCDNDGRLVNNCNICTCNIGYYCSDEGICLINNNITHPINDTNMNETNQSKSDESKDVLWKKIDRNYKISEKGISLSPNLVLQKTNREEILNSPSNLVSEQFEISKVKEKLLLSQDSLENAYRRVQTVKDILDSGSGEEIGDILNTNNEEDVIAPGMYRAIFNNVTENETGPPDMSPPVQPDVDIEVIPCVEEVGGSCIGFYECCEGFVCTGGVCAQDSGVVMQDIEVDDEMTINPNTLVLKDNSGFANLVELGFFEPGAAREVKVIKYATHPHFVDALEVPNAVSFGFYDIKAENAENSGATMSFQILNDLLVLNQIKNLGVYRYTQDKGWEGLELTDVSSNEEITTFTFKSPGFSYFEILGEKDQLLSPDVIGPQNDASSLWAIYTKSTDKGDISFLEVFFGYNDRLMFGSLFGTPFIDLYLDSYF